VTFEDLVCVWRSHLNAFRYGLFILFVVIAGFVIALLVPQLGIALAVILSLVPAIALSCAVTSHIYSTEPDASGKHRRQPASGLTKSDSVYLFWRRHKVFTVSFALAVVLVPSFCYLTQWTTEEPSMLSTVYVSAVTVNPVYRHVLVGTVQGIDEYSVWDSTLAEDVQPFAASQTDNWVTKIAAPEGIGYCYVLLGQPDSRLIFYGLIGHDYSNITLHMSSIEQGRIRDIDADREGYPLYAVGCTGLAIHSESYNTTELVFQRDGLLSNDTRVVRSLPDWVLVGCIGGVSAMRKADRLSVNCNLTYGNQPITPTCIAAKNDLSRIYVGSQKGLFVLAMANGSIAPLPRAGLGLPELPSMEVTDIVLHPSESVLYIGTTAGLCWYDTLEDQYGGSLTGRLQKDTLNVRCLALFDEAHTIKLYVGTGFGLMWIDVASLEQGGRVWTTLSFSLGGFISVALSSAAFLFSLMVFLHERGDYTRAGDIKALYYLRRTRDMMDRSTWARNLSEALKELRKPANSGLEEQTRELNRAKADLNEIEMERKKAVAGLMESVPSASTRYRKVIYEVAARMADIDIYHLVQYTLLSSGYVLPEEGWSLRKSLSGTAIAGEEVAHDEVKNLYEEVLELLRRIETVYFNVPFEAPTTSLMGP